MAFVRFGVDGSQVYIYDDVRGFRICCWCNLAPTPDGFTTNDLDAMLAHVAEHRAAGHVVPDWVEEVLRDEWEDA